MFLRLTAVSPCWKRQDTLKLAANVRSRAFSLSPYKHQSHNLRAPLQIFHDVQSLRVLRRTFFKTDASVGFVPTMGALHDGHISLLRHALSENDAVFVSIFVNPTQFGVNEDLASYPKTWDEDLAKLIHTEIEAGSAARDKIKGVFAPSVKTMYPTLPPSSDIDGNGSFVSITPLSRWLEGASRPVFFRGVATICTKLFNIVQPDRVYFGQKDVQQSVLIKRLVKDFHIPAEVRVIPTSREPDGLAMSSRNVYLGARRRKDSVVLSKALAAAKAVYDCGTISAAKIRNVAFGVFDGSLNKSGNVYYGSGPIEVDYMSLTRPDDMSPIVDSDDIDRSQGAILSAAMKVSPVTSPGSDEERSQIAVRLIDNVVLEPR